MKKLGKIILSMLCAAAMAVPMLLVACGDSENNGPKQEHVDYASQVKLDLDSNTKKQEVTIRLFVDGDTTHFDVVKNSQIKGCNNSNDFYADNAPTKGYAKARYIGINTPESTGQIEEWGKAASKFTRSKLENATSWIIESNDGNWNIDSTGERYLLWVWYLPKGETEYRNLNIEILQAGLAFGSSISESRYAEKAQAALDQAQAEQLYVFSDELDPDYHYGGPINVDLQELRFNTTAYENSKIQVQGNVVAKFNNSVYIEDTFYNVEGYEGEGIRIGMPVYYSYTKGKVVDEILAVGNRVSVVGVLQYYETGGYYQITDIKPYDRYKPVENCEIIEDVGLDNAFHEIDPAQFASNEETVKVQIKLTATDGNEYFEDILKTFRETILGTSVTVSNLYVYDVWTTVNEESSSKGAMTLSCRAADGTNITVRTEVLKDENGNLVTESAYKNKTITVKGVVELFSGSYQVKCHRADYITVVG